MKLRTLIIDDEPIALEKLKKYVLNTPDLILAEACDNGFDALAYLSENEVDLIITDINMPDLNGLDFIKSLREKPQVIITTAYSDYAVDGFKVSATGFLLKPYDYPDFCRAVNRAVAVAENSEAKIAEKSTDLSIFVKTEHRYVRISLDDILYIKGYGEYLQIFTEDRKAPLVTLSSFAAIKEKLTDNFLHVHRSYIANMNKIASVERGRIIIDDETEIPVGDSFKANLLRYISTNVIGGASTH